MEDDKSDSDVSDDLVSRLTAMLERISEASENQIRLLDERITELHDRGEAATDRLIKGIEDRSGIRLRVQTASENTGWLPVRIEDRQISIWLHRRSPVRSCIANGRQIA